MNEPMKRIIYQRNDGLYGFVDDVDEEFDSFGYDDIVRMFADTNAQITLVHQRFYEDVDGDFDGLQLEEDLPEGRYIVCWWLHYDDDVLQLVDYGISKQEIIINVLAQKYRGGAEYFMM